MIGDDPVTDSAFDHVSGHVALICIYISFNYVIGDVLDYVDLLSDLFNILNIADVVTPTLRATSEKEMPYSLTNLNVI
jgi:hypothetical protein